MITGPELRLPATTPRVSKSSALAPNEVIAMEGTMFTDGQRRIVVHSDVSDETVQLMTRMLQSMEMEEGRRRWIEELLGVSGNRSNPGCERMGS